MASTALVKLKESRNRARLRSAYEMAKREHSMFSVAAATVLGIAEAKGHRLPEVMGIDGTIVAGIVALFLADGSGGQFGRVLQSLADGSLAIGAYKIGRSVGGSAIKGLGEAEAIEAVLAA